MLERSFLFLLASGRNAGNSEILAREAAKSLPNTKWLRLNDLELPIFIDHRHSNGYPLPSGNEKILFEATTEATDIVFVAPVYWYSLPSSAKLYLDYWSAWLRHKEIDFKQAMKGKNLWLITANTDEIGDDSGAEPLVQILQSSAKYMGMNWCDCLMGHGSKPGDVLKDTESLRKAQGFFS